MITHDALKLAWEGLCVAAAALRLMSAVVRLPLKLGDGVGAGSPIRVLARVSKRIRWNMAAIVANVIAASLQALAGLSK